MWKFIVIFVATGIHCSSSGHPFDLNVAENEMAEQQQNTLILAEQKPNQFGEMLPRLYIKVNLTCNLEEVTETSMNDYRYTPGIGYHKLDSRQLTWNQARKACNAECGYLAVINSDEEAQVLKELINSDENSGHPAYLGIHDLFEEGDWTTVFGEPLSLTGWNKWTDKWPNQPDNAYGGQHCGALHDDGKLDDFVCSMLHSFICELF